MRRYQFIFHQDTLTRADALAARMNAGARVGRRLQAVLLKRDREGVDCGMDLLQQLQQTREPQIFAESQVYGDGSDWTLEELSLLGDSSVAVPVTVFDDGVHARPTVHATPFSAHLLFTAGALLRNGCNLTPADWDEVVRDGVLDEVAYRALCTRRILPVLSYANERAAEAGREAIVTLPGLGCGQFAGPFAGRLAPFLYRALVQICQLHAADWPQLRLVYFDPYNECTAGEHCFAGLRLRSRPFLRCDRPLPQLCSPVDYAEGSESFVDAMLFSVVAWDHVSWPGNDFWAGSRATDDGVKAAATDLMQQMTGLAGFYDSSRCQYQPPPAYRVWEQVVRAFGLQMTLQLPPLVYPTPPGN